MDADSDPDDLDLLSSDDEEGQDKGHRKKTRKSDKKDTPKDQDEMETEVGSCCCADNFKNHGYSSESSYKFGI